MPANLSDNIVELCGSYANAVDAVATFGRALWALAFEEGQSQAAAGAGDDNCRVIDERRLLAGFSSLLAKNTPPTAADAGGLQSVFMRKLQEAGYYWLDEKGASCFHLFAFQPLHLARALLSYAGPEHETRYFIMRNIRRFYGCSLTPHTAKLFRVLAGAVNARQQSILDSGAVARNGRGSEIVWDYRGEFFDLLKKALPKTQQDGGSGRRCLELFAECCRATGYLWASGAAGAVAVRASAIDADYLISSLFGMPTGIRGFDELFNGGGLLLVDQDCSAGTECLKGRTTLITGRFGTGKTLLAMQLAVEVARKGGLAWYMPLEQTPEECLYTLESMGVLPECRDVRVCADIPSATEALVDKTDGRGALIILSTVREEFGAFLDTFAENAKLMSGYPLRLIVADPINSVSRAGKLDVTELRAQMLETITEIEQSGTNILFVAEDNSDLKNDLRFEENIADTVISLSARQRHNSYTQRYFEVTKSRLQRELPGLHPFSITSGRGITIYPSSSAVSARIRTRSADLGKAPVQFGLPSLDAILTDGSILRGDTIALHGPTGSLKSSLGLLFLLESDVERLDGQAGADPTGGGKLRPLSLLVSARADEFSFRHMLALDYIRHHTNVAKTPANIRICVLPSGYITPGEIFQRIEDEFQSARAGGHWIDRVMVDGVSHWEMSCPFVRDDETFGGTLVDYLRRRSVTSLLICGDQPFGKQSVLQQSIIDDADCVIKFDRIEYRGLHRALIRVLRTRGMAHRRESFELTLSRGLEINQAASLLRVKPSGEVKPIRVSLFLHGETSNQLKSYNEQLLKKVQSLLSPETKLVSQNRIYLSSGSKLASSSTVDELQLFQLDEFQIPDSPDGDYRNFPLHVFPASQWDEGEWNNFLPRLTERIRTPDQGFFGIPYYGNLSLLAYRQEGPEEFDAGVLSSWQGLVAACERWEQAHPSPKEIFFDFPKVTVENYNCLFWEILLTIEKVPPASSRCRLRDWLNSPAVVEAGKIYRRLCRRAYFAEPNKRQMIAHQIDNVQKPIQVNKKAVVWRHWYSTLNEMMYGLSVEDQKKIKVVPLPSDITTAGEWYWALPANSAAPEVGLDLIKLLTKREAELERMELGIGLPTRQTYYDDLMRRLSEEVLVPPFLTINSRTLNGLVNGAFRRSDFGCYSQIYLAMAHVLQRIIEISDEQDIEGEIQMIVESFRSSTEFIRADRQCRKCKADGLDGGCANVV